MEEAVTAPRSISKEWPRSFAAKDRQVFDRQTGGMGAVAPMVTTAVASG